MIDPLAGQYLPMLHTEPLPCDQCGGPGPSYTAVAVMLNNPRRVQPCAECLQKIRVRQWLPETRRLLAARASFNGMVQLLLPGQEPDAPPPMPPSERAVELVRELCRMVDDDPNRGTEHETAYFGQTRPRTREIGAELYEIGGHSMMILAYDMVRQRHGVSARSLEINWSGIGEWFD